MPNLIKNPDKNQDAKSDNYLSSSSIPSGIIHEDVYKMSPKEFDNWVKQFKPVEAAASKRKRKESKSVKEREPLCLRPWDDVQFTRQGDVYGELLYMSQGFHGATIKKLDNERYQVIKSGEIRYFGENEHKIKDNLTKTFRELIGILRANFKAGTKNQVFMTLTYAENMTDPEKLYDDFVNFWKRLTRKYSKHKLEYVAVAEPQKRGAWHMHVFIKSDQEYLDIRNRLLTTYEMTKPEPGKKSERVKDAKGKPIITGGIWGHGATQTERLKGDDAGQYYISYFTNVIVGAENGDEHFLVQSQKGQKGLKDVGKVKKKVEKGARIPMYPKHFKLYRCSKGIIRPQPEMTKYEYITDEYQTKTKTRAIDILEGDRIINTLQYESFKKEAAPDES